MAGAIPPNSGSRDNQSRTSTRALLVALGAAVAALAVAATGGAAVRTASAGPVVTTHDGVLESIAGVTREAG